MRVYVQTEMSVLCLTPIIARNLVASVVDVTVTATINDRM